MVHLLDTRTGYGLCGAGKPGKQFPFGSAQRVFTDDDRIMLTCYRCIKLKMMNEEMGKPPRRRRKRRPNPVDVRTFSPTHGDNRDEHIMVLGGRKGPFGAGREELEYDFEDSPWEPGPPKARTQPKAWAGRKPSKRQTRYKKDVLSDEEFAEAQWTKFRGKEGLDRRQRARGRQAARRRAMEDEVEDYYAQEKKDLNLNPNRDFDPRAKWAELTRKKK